MKLGAWGIRLRMALVLSLWMGGVGLLMGERMPRSLSWLGAQGAIAQVTVPCVPPEADEYLVLVNQPTPESLEQLRAVLPNASTTAVCQYLDKTVIRVGGFATEAVATAWANYLAQTLAVQTAIVLPATPFSDANEPIPPTPPNPPQTGAPGYNPQRLGEGYAVLVDYADRPDVAIALQSTLGTTVGVAVYRQAPYLLATYSADAVTAGTVLTQLATANFNAILVDSRQVIRMVPAVNLSGSMGGASR
ncbi:MAG: hypothetical protein VKJ64_01495 [Leptolyngbyaceae bacterium]|nr:hypothetical protein [Leptolyngbyaceae bacterium]